MNKYFYAVIPFDPLSDKQKNFFKRLLDSFKPAMLIKLSQEKFLRRRQELSRRADTVIRGLASVGVNSVELDTQGLIELYYNTYNPRTSSNQKLVDINQLRISE